LAASSGSGAELPGGELQAALLRVYSVDQRVNCSVGLAEHRRNIMRFLPAAAADLYCA